MKLRIRDDSIRLRLERGEVDALANDGVVAARTHFGNGCEFRYRIESRSDISDAGASFADATLAVHLPAAAVAAWAGSEQVSIRARQAAGRGSELAILVEKDFACLAPRPDEDESDMFPHPGGSGGQDSSGPHCDPDDD